MLSNAILSAEPDIVCINETHWIGNHKIELQGYKCFAQNRQEVHINANKGSGGVATYIRSTLLNDFEVSIVDKSRDDILIMSLTNKTSKYSFLVIKGYLPPENTVRGQNAMYFFAHILGILYLYTHYDAYYMAADLNAPIGGHCDYIQGLEDIRPRTVIDNIKRGHGDTFLEFLKDSKSCVLNGRFDANMDNYTSVSSRGKAIVDYIITSHEALNTVEYFKVLLARDLINPAEYGSAARPPDHSMLMCQFRAGHANLTSSAYTPVKCAEYDAALPRATRPRHANLNSRADNHVTPSSTGPPPHANLTAAGPGTSALDDVNRTDHANVGHQRVRYNVNNIPGNFMDSEMNRAALMNIINTLEQQNIGQSRVDDTYNTLCDVYHVEMNQVLDFKEIGPKSKKVFRHRHKPYWNAELQELWNKANKAEKQFLRCSNSDRQNLRALFKACQQTFDKRYRKLKRQYQRSVQCDIERLNTENPKEFWDTLKKLGPQKNTEIPMEVYDMHGNITTDQTTVLNTWKNDFETIFNSQNADSDFDDDFYADTIRAKIELENEMNTGSPEHNELMDSPITVNELITVLRKAKNNKAVGMDNLPNEILKLPVTLPVLHSLYNAIFSTGLVPTLWRMAILKPLPKGSTTDPRIPSQYRGISLLSTVSKIYTSILNNRMTSHMDSTGQYADEQNGFRKSRSCEDHIFTLTSIIRNRKQQGLSTYVAYIDAEKAFDRIDRDMLLYKLLACGVHGKLYHSVKSLYASSYNLINVNGHFSEAFRSKYGVKQGDCLSTTLFNIYANDLIDELNQCNSGLQLGDISISALLYADDLVLISSTEAGLQSLLDTVYAWCRKWRMTVNCSKSNIVHYRKKSQPQTTFTFTLGRRPLDTVTQYKYLGVTLDQHMDFSVTSSLLAGAGGRALGAIIQKAKCINGLGYTTYTTMFNSGVAPILDYCSGIWGFGVQSRIDTIQNKAIRAFLGVHSYAPNYATQADMGWTPAHIRRKICMVRFWNRLIQMDDSRLTKRIFLWDMSQKKKNWSQELSTILESIGKKDSYRNLEIINIQEAWSKLFETHCLEWKELVKQKPKLRTYRQFKQGYGVEPYCTRYLPRHLRSILAQLRFGILPLEIETGRYVGLAAEDRTCKLCDASTPEDECHFLFHCARYDTERALFNNTMTDLYPDFTNSEDSEKLNMIMNEKVVYVTAKYIKDIYDIRRSLLFNT